jgi:NDP-sugar pyrophosphorylase family protein
LNLPRKVELQIVIPMSGFGERFRRAGFKIPKPLLVVEGKPIIQHVVDLFPGDHDFTFICNEDHLANPEFRMREILEATGVRHRVVSIAPHKLGPVHAILSVKELLEPSVQTIVNYADFTCLWNFNDFSEAIADASVHGAVPAYRGFHPHSGGTTNYAYIRETNFVLEAIREKKPFTSNKTKEFASTGTYYFESASTMFHYLERQVEEDINVEGEFYVSSAFDLMAKDNRNVLVYEIHHFMQWGTPKDLAEYEFWSQKLSNLANFQSSCLPIGKLRATLLLASGLGSRFLSKGYETPKPLLKISGQTILEQVRKVSDKGDLCLVSSLDSSGISEFVSSNEIGESVSFSELSEGQADSTRLLSDHLPSNYQGPFTVLPTDTIFANEYTGWPQGLEAPDTDILTVWAYSPNYFNLGNPESFGWIGEIGNDVWSAVKTVPPHSDSFVMSGAFTFSSINLFSKLHQTLYEFGPLVNGERYLDSMVQVAIDTGVQVKIFIPSFTLSLGTPYEFETFRYWQSCFDQWDSHPYNLEKDPFVQTAKVKSAREELRKTLHQPEEWGLVARN